jgi:hypothetical protein
MRTASRLVVAAFAASLPVVAGAQSPDPAGEPTEYPAAQPLPPLPPPGADFKQDQKLFEEVLTEPEVLIAERERAQTEEMKSGALRYQRTPMLAYATQAGAGLLAAGLVGLGGAAVGEAIAPGDEEQPLGGFRGPVIGGFAGAAIGSAVGVWGGGYLFDKQTHPGWVALGTAAGTVVGGGAALGIAALGTDDTLTATAAVGTMVLFQVAGAILFGDLFLPPPAAVEVRPKMIKPPEDADLR